MSGPSERSRRHVSTRGGSQPNEPGDGDVYRLLFAASPLPMWVIDRETLEFLDVNDAAITQYGYSRDEFATMTLPDLHPPEDVSRLHERFAEPTVSPRNAGEVRHRLKDGRVIWVQIKTHEIDFNGRPARLGSLEDITARKASEEEIARLAAIAESSEDAITSRDLQGRIISWNPAAERLYGYAASEVIGRRGEFLEPSDRPGEVAEIVRRGSAGDSVRLETTRLTKSGTTVDVAISVFPLTDRQGQPLGVGAIHRDITERKRRQEEINRLISILDATTDFVGSADTGGNVYYLNRGARRMLGLREDEDITGRKVSDDHPAWAAEKVTREGLPVALRDGSWEGESAILGPDNREIPTSQVILAHKRGDGTVQFFSTVARDISERKRAEEELKERTRQLATLLSVSYNVSSTLEIGPLLGLILEQLKSVVDYSAAAVLVIEGDSLVVREYSGDLTAEETLGLRFQLDEIPFYRQVLASRSPIIDDCPSDDCGDADCAPGALACAFPDARSRLGVPLQVKDRLIGLFCIDHREPGRYRPSDGELALAIANHAALAIENARLYEQARQLAVVEERQRLARELHDSVSQVLFGIGLGAHAATTMVDAQPDQAKDAIEYIRSLAEAGLTEMRALIFDLRPESIEQEGLVAALARQQSLLWLRHGIKVETSLCAEPTVALEVKEALYRIGREALQNVVKHALANEATLGLLDTPDGLVLEVSDNGVGFDATGSFPGHLGLQSMRERAAQAGATIEITSTVGKGTRLRVCIPRSASSAR